MESQQTRLLDPESPAVRAFFRHLAHQVVAESRADNERLRQANEQRRQAESPEAFTEPRPLSSNPLQTPED